ncbi:hypothetical protein ACWFMI_24005 [Nocardiopsis terrae]|uniref:hypothetical protein n=1 Tax=Streptomyces sp. NPDC057554 TaxID=3350538 RepID=UPI0036A11F07
MSSTDDDATQKAARKAVGALLVARRTEISARFRRRPPWVSHTSRYGLYGRIVKDLEQGVRANFEPSTWTLIRQAYQLPHNWYERAVELTLQGHEPDPLPEPQRLDPTPDANDESSSQVLLRYGLDPDDPDAKEILGLTHLSSAEKVLWLARLADAKASDEATPKTPTKRGQTS